MARVARVEVITRVGCHLCADALAVVAEVCGRLGEAYEETDVELDPDLVAELGWDVPVVRVDGRVLSVHSVTAVALDKALRAAPGRWRPW